MKKIMASRKDLKKGINYICGELIAECIVNSKKDSNAADKVMVKVLNTQNDFINRISHTESGNVKGYYKKLRSDFDAKTDEIIADIDTLNA